MMRRPRNLSPDEKQLWEKFARGVTPLEPGKKTDLAKEMEQAFRLKPAKKAKLSKPAKPAKPVAGRAPAKVPHTPAPNLTKHKQTINGTEARKLRKGRAQIDARLDLHGMRQAEAHQALNSFILRVRDKGARCVLVITGKGNKGTKGPKGIGHSNPYETPGPGVLRSRLRQWVGQEPLHSICYGVEEAHPTHGGSGAFYIFIRKK